MLNSIKSIKLPLLLEHRRVIGSVDYIYKTDKHIKIIFQVHEKIQGKYVSFGFRDLGSFQNANKVRILESYNILEASITSNPVNSNNTIAIYNE